MYWVDGSPEQSVPQTPPIFYEFVYNSTSSPYATVPEQDVHSNQESQEEANVPGTPVCQLNIQSHVTSKMTLETNSNKCQSRYGTPLLELVLLKSARKHAKEMSESPQNDQKTQQSEQTVPSTPKQNPSDRLTMCNILKNSPVGQSITCAKLDLFQGDEIFPK